MAKRIPLPKKYPIPDNWQWVEMEKLTFMRSGYPFDSSMFATEHEGRRPLIRIRDIVRGETTTYTDEKCPDEYIVHCGDVLIGMDGDFNVAKWKSENALLNQRVCYISTASKALLNDYLFYYLPDPLKKINDATPSVTVKHLSIKTLGKTSIPLPPIPEQQRIVDRIESLFAKLDEAKEKAQAVVDGFEDRKAAILHKAFTGELTAQWRESHKCVERWKKKRLKDCGEWIGGGTPSMSHPEYWENGDILWITSKDMKADLIEDTLVHTNMLGVSNSSAKYCDKPSVIFVMRSGILRRTLPIAMVKIPFTINQDLKAVSPEEVNLDYLFWACESNEKIILNTCMKSGTTVESINATALMNYEVPIAPRDEQQVITATIERLLSQEQHAKEAAETVIDQIDVMKKSILARAFRGDLGTNDPNDESAVELLKSVL